VLKLAEASSCSSSKVAKPNDMTLPPALYGSV
jgi:hypothetical protein